MAKKIRGATALTGGGTGAVDAISGSVLADGDVVMAFAGGQVYPYVVDADSGLSESSPNIIAPDTSPGDKRLILQHFPHETDALCTYGGGVNYTQATIEAALTAIGTTNKTTLLLRPGTWVISSNADWSAYTNVTFKIVPGAIISHGAFTVNIPNLSSGPNQVFSGTGAVTLSGNIDLVDPRWFGAILGDGSTDCKTAFDYAVTAAPTGGSVYVPLGKWKIATAWSFSKQVNLVGDGPGSVLWIQGLAGSDAITFGPAAGYIYGVHWRDFAILGGATCAANGLVLRNANNSVFDNVHVMLGSTVASVWIKTFAIINKYNFIISSNMIASYAYTPSIHEGKAIYASAAADAAGTFNANEFDLIVEGGSGKGLHILSDAASGKNMVKGTYEGITNADAILIEGGDGTRILDGTYLESTGASTNVLRFLNHDYGYIGAINSFPFTGGGYNDVQLENSDQTIINGARLNRLGIDAASNNTHIDSIYFVGEADYGLYDSSSTTRYYGFGSNATIATATPTTIFTPSGTSAIWEIFAFINNAGAGYLANGRVMWDGGAVARLVTEDDSNLTLTLAGTAVQVTQTSGGAANVFWRIFKGASR